MLPPIAEACSTDRTVPIASPSSSSSQRHRAAISTTQATSMPSLSFRRKEWHSMPEMSRLLPLASGAQHKSDTQQRNKTWLHWTLLLGFLLLYSQLQSCASTQQTLLHPPETETAASTEPPRAKNKNNNVASAQQQQRSAAAITPKSDPSSSSSQQLLVQTGDFVYTSGDWDGAPVVIEEHKLIFFTAAKVGCTTWKQLFRRMMGFRDWKIEECAYPSYVETMVLLLLLLPTTYLSCGSTLSNM